MYLAIQSQPPGSVQGSLRITEQVSCYWSLSPFKPGPSPGSSPPAMLVSFLPY